MLAAYEESDFEKMEEIRGRADAIVRDPDTAGKLKAWYRQLCKRPCFHDEYLQAFNNPNTHLVDTDGKGVARITAAGVIVAGREYELDCVIYGSGFGFGTLEPSADAETAWVELLLTGPGSMIGGPDCTPGYYNNEGQDPGQFLGYGYPYGPRAYFAYIDKWRASGTFDGLEFQ